MTLTLITLTNGGVEPTITTTLTSQRFSVTGPASSGTALLPATTSYDPPNVTWTATDQPAAAGSTAAGCETTASASTNSNYTFTVRMFIGGTTRADVNSSAASWTDQLVSATRFYDETRFLEIKSKSSFNAVQSRGGLTYHITVVYSLKNPYWHDTPNDGSRRLFP